MSTLHPPAPEHDLSEEPPPVPTKPPEDMSTGRYFKTTTKYHYIRLNSIHIINCLQFPYLDFLNKREKTDCCITYLCQ